MGNSDEAVVGGDVNDPQSCPARVAKVAVSLVEAASANDRREAVLVAGEDLVQQPYGNAEPGRGAGRRQVAVDKVFFDVAERGVEQAPVALGADIGRFGKL